MIKIGKSVNHISVYTCKPQSRVELISIIKDRIDKEGNNCDLNDIDVSLVDDISFLFNLMKDFNGDISNWDVSNAKNMSGMFYKSKFDQDISKWNVSNTTDTSFMFANSKFNGDISKWNVRNVKNMYSMFIDSNFNQDISYWKITKDCKTNFIFNNCPIREEYKPKSLKK